MIRLEAVEDGFVVTLDGRRALAHSARAPLLELGTAEAVVRQRKGGFKLRQRRLAMTKAKAWKLVSSDDHSIELEFPGLASVGLHEELGAIVITCSGYARTANRFKFRIPAVPGESVFGGGEQFSRLDLKGSRLPLWSDEQGIGRGHDLVTLLADIHSGAGGSWHSTYFGQPSFVTSGRMWVHVDTTARCVLDFRKPRVSTIEAWAVPARLTLSFAPDVPTAVGALSRLVGRQPGLPAWTWDGAWLGAQGGSAAIREKLDAARKAGAKIGAVWAQDWCGTRFTSFGKQVMWDWSYDREAYPGLPDAIAELKREGIRFLGYVNPYLAADGKLYAEASAAGYLVKRRDGGDYLLYSTTFPFAIVDLWNPDAYAWLKGVIKREMLGVGMSGWMADFGEYLPVDSVLHGGVDPMLAHNEYPVLWAKVNADAVREAGKEGEAAFFLRSGWTGASRYASSFWAGDQLVNWSKTDGLPSVVPAALSLGFSGAGYWHSDIGGYTTLGWIKRNREVLLRWAELAAFSPIMRTHEGNRPGSNAQVWSDPATLAHFARMTSVWTGLAPYHLAVAAEYQASGVPPIRHTWLHYEGEAELRRLDRQFMYGRDLLVAPVLKPGLELSDAVLPDDHWAHLWTSREFRGGLVTIEAPLGYPPVFYRAESQWASLFEGLRRSVKKL